MATPAEQAQGRAVVALIDLVEQLAVCLAPRFVGEDGHPDPSWIERTSANLAEHRAVVEDTLT